MIQANELRIGNLIGLNLSEFPQNFFKVLEVAETNMKVTDDWIRTEKRPESHFFDCDLMEGIPLTPEWLERAGFEECSHHFGTYFKNENCWIYMFPKSEKFELELIAGSERFNLCRQYNSNVHTLQNLYFSLTGEELKFK